MFAAATPEFRALLTCSLLSAQRIGDVSKWKPSAFDRHAKILAFTQGKTKVQMRLRVPDAMAAAFDRMAGRASGRLLCSPRGRAWTEDNAKDMLAVLRRDLGIERYVIHGLRSTGPTALLDLGWPVESVMALTGHRDRKSFSLYVRGTDKTRMSAPAAIDLARHFGEVIAAAEAGGNARKFAGLTGRAAAKAKRLAAAGAGTGNSLATGNQEPNDRQKT